MMYGMKVYLKTNIQSNIKIWKVGTNKSSECATYLFWTEKKEPVRAPFHNATLYLLIFRLTSIKVNSAAIAQRPLNQRNSEENSPPKKAIECTKQVMPNNQSMNFNSFDEYL